MGLGHIFGSCCAGAPPGLYSQSVSFPWTPDASALGQSLWVTDPGASEESQLTFLLEEVGLAGALVAELLNFLFGKAG